MSLIGLTAAADMLQASEIYKSLDANGNVTYSDHLDPSASQSSVVHLEDAGYPPRVLHFCWTNCFTLILDQGVYRRTDGTDENWTVEAFSPTAIVLHRHDAPADWNGYSPDVVYAGQVSDDRLIGVTVNGKATSGIDASWGIALNTLPGSNAERDAPSNASLTAQSSDTVSTSAAPPPLPVEDQPTLPQDDYLWTPGYWYWRNQGYRWIPGTWMHPPQVGVLWTPGYWSVAGTVFVFHPGHWGSSVGFYGGVNYGYGYFGSGYSGGHWVGTSFAYNSAVNHLNPSTQHTYVEPVIHQSSRGVVSYTGGPSDGATTHTVSQHRLQPQADQPVTTPMVHRTIEPASQPTAFNRPAADAKTPAPHAVQKVTHATSTRTAPSKQ